METKPVFKGVFQVGLVVRDCMASVKRYTDDYGIGPWGIYEMNPTKVHDMVIRGRKEEYAFRAAVAYIGSTMIELIEPLDEKSIYSEFLNEHGEGIHHLLFDVPDYGQTMGFLQGRGIEPIQGGNNHGLEYAYFDTTRELGFVTELMSVAAGAPIPQPDYVYPFLPTGDGRHEP